MAVRPGGVNQRGNRVNEQLYIEGLEFWSPGGHGRHYMPFGHFRSLSEFPAPAHPVSILAIAGMLASTLDEVAFVRQQSAFLL
jgi:hypothetical protein